MRITVVGGSGFIGTHLVARLLAAGHDVRVFDRRPSTLPDAQWMPGDVRDAAAVSDAVRGAALVVDLAAEHRDDVRPVSLYHEVNVGGARNVAAAAAQWRVGHVVFASSAAVYGRGQPGANEASALRPDTPYGTSKVAAEAVYTAWQHDDPARRALTVVRPSVVYGEGHHGNLRLMMAHLRRGRFVLVDGGRNRKSVAYVGNLVAFLEHVLAPPAGVHVYNYADAPAPTVRELAGEILAQLPGAPRRLPVLPRAPVLAAARLAQAWARWRGRDAAITPARVLALCATTTLDVGAAQRAGFVAPYSRGDALARTLRNDAGA